MPDSRLEQTFLAERPRLFQLAYRMMGSVADADDALQDVFVRLRSGNTLEVQAPDRYLTRAVVHRCLDRWKSAGSRREQYVGQWLPEPLAADDRDDPARRAELAESISLAFLVVLEALDPLQRAVFLLHDVFGYSFQEVATVVDKSAAACRQIAHRARLTVDQRRPRFPASPEQHRQLVNRFLDVCRTGDLAGMQAILAEDVTFTSDGGGLTPAARVPLVGFDRVARFLLGLRRKSLRSAARATLKMSPVNGAPGILQFIGGRLHSVISLEADAGRIRRLFAVLNPQKLAALAAALEEGA
jgi:RNA polymerase sigma-70 factor (ECF subfamily)